MTLLLAAITIPGTVLFVLALAATALWLVLGLFAAYDDGIEGYLAWIMPVLTGWLGYLAGRYGWFV